MAQHSCTYCQNPIVTCRIQCVECSDFDLCLQCFACGVEAGPHKKEHDYQVLACVGSTRAACKREKFSRNAKLKGDMKTDLKHYPNRIPKPKVLDKPFLCKKAATSPKKASPTKPPPSKRVNDRTSVPNSKGLISKLNAKGHKRCNKCKGPIRGRAPKTKPAPGRPRTYEWCRTCILKADMKHRMRTDDGTFSVFDSPDAWTTSEEEMLLDAVEQYGFGNWDDVANHVKSKTSTDCQQHYYAFYLHGNIGRVTFTNEPAKRVIDHTCPNGGPLSPSLSTSSSAPELSPLEQHELGYMPLRDDFEREYDNEAESLVSGLAINYDDEDLDIAFKLAQVDIYRQRLKERQRRKAIAKEFGVIQNSTSIGVKRLQANKKKQSKEDREFQDRMRVFAQFHSAKEHESFFESLQKEKKLKHRIKELMKFRKNGITKFDDCADYEAEKLNRDKKRDKKSVLGSTGNSNKRSSMGIKKENEEDVNIIIGDIRRNGVKGDLASAPSVELLSDREKKLCSTIGMKPASYITVKTCIIKDYLQRRHGVPIKIRYPSHLDKTHRRRILNFLSENGWIGNVAAF